MIAHPDHLRIHRVAVLHSYLSIEHPLNRTLTRLRSYLNLSPPVLPDPFIPSFAYHKPFVVG